MIANPPSNGGLGTSRRPSIRSLSSTAGDLGSPVSLDYFDQAPFTFNGTIGTTTIKYLKK
jgi:hypothetical protein